MTSLGKIEMVSSSMKAILSAHTCGRIFGIEVWVHLHFSWASTWCCRISSVVFASMLMFLFEFQFATSVGRIGVASSPRVQFSVLTRVGRFLSATLEFMSFFSWALTWCCRSSPGFFPSLLMFLFESVGGIEVVISPMSAFLTHMKYFWFRFLGSSPVVLGA